MSPKWVLAFCGVWLWSLNGAIGEDISQVLVHRLNPDLILYTQTKQVPVQYQVEQTITKYVTEQREVDGKTVVVKLPVSETVTKVVTKLVTAHACGVCSKQEASLSDEQGQPVAFDTPRIGKTPMLVVLQQGATPLTPGVRGLFRQGTLFLTLKPIAPQPAPRAVPAPAVGIPAPVVAPALPAPPAPVVADAPPPPAETPAITASLPDAPAPLFLTARREGAEGYRLRMTSTVHQVSTVMNVVTKAGKTVQQPLTIQQQVTTDVSQVLGSDLLTFYAGNGQKVPNDRITDRFSREVNILYASDGLAINPFWLQNLKPNTIVLSGPILPTAPAAGAMSSIPAPAVEAPHPPTVAPQPAPVIPLPVPQPAN